MIGIIRYFLKNRNSKSFYFRLSYFLIFIALLVYSIWCHLQNIQLTDNHYTFLYTNKGSIHSEINLEKNNDLTIEYNLKASEGTEPYAGVAFVLKEHERQKFGLFDEIILEISSNEDKIIPVLFAEEIEESVNQENNIKERVWTYDLNVKKGQHTYVLSINSFKIIFWWFKENNISISKLPEYRPEKVKYIAIQNDRLQEYEIQDKFQIKKLYLNRRFNVLWFIILFLFVTLFESLNYYLKLKTRKIEFSPLSFVSKNNDNDWEIIKTSIANNYHLDEFKLDFIQNDTGIHKSKISKLIKTNLNLSFKQYLNQIRIHEASRLLKSVDLNISEIAYKVGFSNISHFNRVFKEIQHCSPREFRSNTVA